MFKVVSKSNPLFKSKRRFVTVVIQSLILFFCIAMFALPNRVCAQNKNATPEVPDWALPGSATHKQVPPPADFHRATRTEHKKIGIFEGQSDVGAAVVRGSSSYNPSSKAYTITSAGYNIWYTRDEFRYIWKKMSGDVSLAGTVHFPDSSGYNDRKVVVIIRQNLDDDAKEAMVALHGAGLMHLAWRPEKNAMLKEERIPEKGAQRIGIEKKGENFTIWVSMTGEPMHQLGEPIQLHLNAPFYVGLGFCSHQPAVTDTGVVSDVVLENEAGKVK